ncbi:MAG: helix-turn-helix domain-containing protein [Myxococcales bacterium]|nr:helix-turn-helix domain-containing protein [Myxococcales bacterium]
MNQHTAQTVVCAQFLTRAQAAAWLGLSISTLHRLVQRGLVPVHRFCRKLQFDPRDLQSFVRARRTAVRSPDHYGDPKDQG